MTAGAEQGREWTNRQNPYEGSAAVHKVRRAQQAGRPVRLACLDIDSTLTGEPSLANEVRARLEAEGYIVAFDTSRTEEMVLSSGAFERSGDQAIGRPPPLLGGRSGEHFYLPPERREPYGVLDGDLIAGSTGTRILVRQEDGTYQPDREYESGFGTTPDQWRRGAVQLLDRVTAAGGRFELAPSDQPGEYGQGRSDVFLPLYRIQVNFSSLEEKLRTLQFFRRERRRALAAGDRTALNLRFVDDSRPDTDNYKGFLTPHRGGKTRAAERMVDCLCRVTGLRRADLQILFCGDSFPDLRMGLLGGLGTDAVLLLAGASRLVTGLTAPDEQAFAGEGLLPIRRRLHPTGNAGEYGFALPAQLGKRRLLVGDLAYPGTEAVETVYRYLDTMSSP